MVVNPFFNLPHILTYILFHLGEEVRLLKEINGGVGVGIIGHVMGVGILASHQSLLSEIIKLNQRIRLNYYIYKCGL